ncbi:hypothetical protein BaRGS_00002129 [Batillaria attramentaria]|uniref:Uncharacterized protein n=1 Tax=Batillaria attramentaria TaxID=370345 RepID=A0ABD0M4A1_9CAEN
MVCLSLCKCTGSGGYGCWFDIIVELATGQWARTALFAGAKRMERDTQGDPPMLPWSRVSGKTVRLADRYYVHIRKHAHSIESVRCRQKKMEHACLHAIEKT